MKGLENYQRFGNWFSFSLGRGVHRIVNQKEIVEYFKQNPGKTERQMQEELYGYYRSLSRCSNKKYADRLRAALYSGKLHRVKAKTAEGERFIYFAI